MEGSYTWLVGVLSVSLLGNIGQMLTALIKRPPNGANGSIATVKGEIAIHTLNCPNLKPVLDRLTSIEMKLDNHIQFHLGGSHEH